MAQVRFPNGSQHDFKYPSEIGGMKGDEDTVCVHRFTSRLNLNP